MEPDKNFKKVLAAYHGRMAIENQLMASLQKEEGMKRRDEFLLSVGEDVATFLNTLAKSAKSKTILEIGTSYGYSTLWLAEAAQNTGGKVITLEIDDEKVQYAKEKINEAGLSNYVEFRVGDALESIKKAKETFDFVLVDIWKELYVPCLNAFYAKLNKGAWVLGDNMLFPPHHHKEAKEYQDHIRNNTNFTSILLPIGSGIEVSQFNPK
ncbi:O-methyltransferase [Maribacter sp. CXY002]|uniref:O-methyltransferase n=1 Tax=Maribacter luteocoastalis TaxID=3407671 RepID=UPI003B6749FE